VNPRLLATVIAVPVAVLTGVLVYNLGMPASSAQPSSSPNAAATSAVTVPAPSLSARSALVCRALVARLPERVRTAQRRPVSAGPEQNAAYGDPAMTLQCGVPRAEFPPTDDVFRLNDVCWHSVVERNSTVWTTVDREVPVRVTVPGPATGASQWTIGFSTVIASTVPSIADVPSGCASLAEPISPAPSPSP
jgi:Protein of unknown function (DUF3515)